MKAQIGDYIKFNNCLNLVIGFCGDYGYETLSGGIIADDEISYDDILLESQV